MKTSFILSTSLLIILRVLDFWTTYRSTPDLSDEINPIHSLLSGGWTMLLITNILAVGLIIYLYYIYSFKYKPRTFIFNADSYFNYVSLVYFNQPNRFYQIFYKMPMDKNVFYGHVGYVLMGTLIFGSMLAVLNNLLHFYRVGFYEKLCEFIVHPAWFIYGVIFIIAIFRFYNLTSKEYKLINLQ